ncbi:MAG: RloB domain-containing protein [Bacteroidales bacterium]|nr:RloB domain-containing protein [Bacteroidales bacterium]
MAVRPIIPIRKTYAFVGDGETELWYLQMLKKNEKSLTVTIKPELPQKKSIEDQFDYVQELSEIHEKVFWIVDTDVVIRETRAFKGQKDKSPAAILKQKYQQIMSDPKLQDKVIFVANTPCLEYWILLHVVQTTRYYDTGDKVIDEIKKHEPLMDYAKTQKYYQQANDIYKRLKPFLNMAKTNAGRTGAFDPDNLEKGLSEMHKIFTELGI